jgi:hypothetical protein
MYKYASIKNFSNINPQNNNPEQRALGMCLADTYDRKFQYGGTVGANSGPRNEQCQNFMAQRCANKWDGFCEYYYQQYGPNATGIMQTNWPNPVWRPWEEKYGLNPRMSLGDQLLKNTAERRYCKLQNCPPTVRSLDPTDPNSVKVTSYDTYVGCVPVCTVNPSTIDADPVMNRVLENPTVAAGTLINICNTSHNQGINLNGTRLGEVCKRYRASM